MASLKEGERSSYAGGQFNRGGLVMLERWLSLMVRLQKWSLLTEVVSLNWPV